MATYNGSLISLQETIHGFSPTPLQSRTSRPCCSPFAAYRPAQSPTGLTRIGRRLRLGRDCGGRVSAGVGFIAGEKQKGKGLRAVGNSGGAIEGVGDDGAGDEEDITDEALRLTIKQSKKVLAVQRDVLQQIAERRKLISTIKNSVGNIENTEASRESEISLTNGDQSATSRDLDYKRDIISDKYVPPSLSELSEAPASGAYGVKLEEKKKLEGISEIEQSLADALGLSREALGLSREATLKADHAKISSPFFSQVAESNDVKQEKVEDLKESTAEGDSGKNDVAPGEVNMASPPLAGDNVMNVILVAAECAPWSKTGGLGDVAGALPKALARRGHRVMVVVPRYGDYAEPREMGVRIKYKVVGQDMEVSYYHVYIDGVDFVFMESPIFRNRQSDIYGGNRPDILQRMILFCKAAAEVPWHVPCGGACYGDGNLVFIANDWHTALLPVYLKAYYRDNGLMKYARCALVIHNIAYQGRGPVDDFRYMDLPDHYIDLFRLYDPIGGEHLNIFAAGLKAADRVVTVSHGYAWELKTTEGGWGLNGIINENDWKFHGIVNGIDAADWNPKYDMHLKSDGYSNYSLETLQTGKSQCKAALQRELGLPVRGDAPILAFIGRLDHQKGVDLIAEAIHWIAGQNVQLVLLGSGRPDLEQLLKDLQNRYNDKVRGWVGFSVKMAHRITAGSDVLLMPSRFEPCGLNQLYAMTYGTVPVVHAVGGLRDTVHQFDPFRNTGYGWTFDRAEPNRLIDALQHCLNTYRNYKDSWEELQKRGMMQDLSWDNAAVHYEEVLVAAKYQW